MKIEEWLGKDNVLGHDIWHKKYQNGDETFEEWLDRISNGNEELKETIRNKNFIFGGRILANRGLGNDRKITYSNCYVVPKVEDSIEGIYDTCAKLARTYSYGGGCGVDISNLRPKGAEVLNAAKETTGAVSFMKTFDTVTSTIGQNGRRGALMISIDARHPDVSDFIDIKTDLNEVTSANISVRVSDEFMECVDKDLDYIQCWPCEKYDILSKDTENLEYDKLYKKETVLKGEKKVLVGYVKKVRAKKLFDRLTLNNWNYAEPGILYWDRISNYNLMTGNKELEYAGVNPCAEEPLPAGGSCLLGSINLSEMVTQIHGRNTVDYSKLKKVSNIAYKALNEVLMEGLKLHPLAIQRQNVAKYRQIGLGIMGLADLFIKLGIKYGSYESLDISDKIAKTILNESIRSSAEYAMNCKKWYKRKRDYFGLTSSELEKSVLYTNNVSKSVKLFVEEVGGIYNTQLLTIAPTGTISTMFNISGGIEPIFALSYTRLTKSLNGTDTEYEVFPKIVEDYFNSNGIEKNLKNLPEYYVSSENIPNNVRLSMQATWQKYIDASISSTINLPEEATVENVSNIYMNAWKYGLKGVTIFRSGCKRAAILTNSNSKKKCECNDFLEKNAPRRPKKLPCKIVRFNNNREKWIAAVGLYEDKPYELFTGLAEKLEVPKEAENIYIVRNKFEGRSRYDIEYTLNGETGVVEGLSTIFKEEYWNYGKLISGLLRHSMPISYVIKVISTLDFKDDSINSWKNGVIRALKEFAKPIETDEVCPECGAKIWNDGGCKVCKNCGWSKCG